MGVTSLLSRPVPAATYHHDSQTKVPKVAASARYAFPHNAGNTALSSMQFNPLRAVAVPVPEKMRRTLRVAAETSSGTSESGNTGRKRTLAKDVKSLREKVNDFVEQKSGYFWLGGPILATAAVFIPPGLVNLTVLLQKNYLAGLISTFVLDILFVLSADLFFVLADKAGHHQTISGGSPPWIGPWEYTGYPKGEPLLTKLVAYAGVAIGVIGVVMSLFIGKLAVGLPAFGSYLALIFVQVAYERLLSNDRVPAYPLVPIVYTVYRYRQLARAMELVTVMGGGAPLAFIIRALTVVWTFYLSMQLTHLPWLYSTWNSNKAT